MMTDSEVRAKTWREKMLAERLNAARRGGLAGLVWPGETVYLCVDSFGTCSVNQAGLELIEIYVPLPPEFWD